MEVISIEESLKDDETSIENEAESGGERSLQASPTSVVNSLDNLTIDEEQRTDQEIEESDRPKRRNKRNIINAPRIVNRYRKDANGRWRRVVL